MMSNFRIGVAPPMCRRDLDRIAPVGARALLEGRGTNGGRRWRKRFASRCRHGSSDFGSKGGNVAGRETFGAGASLPILRNARIHDYRA